MKNAAQQAEPKPRDVTSMLLPFAANNRGPERFIRVGFCMDGERRKLNIPPVVSTIELSKLMSGPVPVPVRDEPSPINKKDRALTAGSPFVSVEPRAPKSVPTVSDGALVALFEEVARTNMLSAARIVVLTASTRVPGTQTQAHS
jgi:hypothetical protein